MKSNNLLLRARSISQSLERREGFLWNELFPSLKSAKQLFKVFVTHKTYKSDYYKKASYIKMFGQSRGLKHAAHGRPAMANTFIKMNHKLTFNLINSNLILPKSFK